MLSVIALIAAANISPLRSTWPKGLLVSHFAYLDVLFGVLKVLEESIFTPQDSGLFVGT